MSHETVIEQTLQDIWDSVQDTTGIYKNRPKINFLGLVKSNENISNGRYIEIQNFIDLTTAKKKGNNEAFRVTFRSMYLKQENEHFLEVVKWTGGNGTSVEETTQLLFGPKNLILNAFHLMMCDALKKSVSTEQPY